MRPKSDVKLIASKISGLQTVESVARLLNVERRTAINIIYRLRKLGLVETTRGAGKKRLYRIYVFTPPKKGVGLYNFISENSKIKIVPRYEQYIYNKLTIEEAIVRAVQSKDFRLILATLNLFTKVTDWSLLNKIARQAKIQRKVGALYDLAKTIMRVQPIDGRTLKSLKVGKDKDPFIIDNLKSKDFQSIEKEWQIYVPFNKADLKEYET